MGKNYDFVFKNSNFKTNRTLNIISGLWSFQPKVQKTLIQIFHFTVLILGVIPECLGIRQHCGKSAVCAEILATLAYFTMLTLKYVFPITSKAKIDFLYKKVADNWSSITDLQEKTILNKIEKSWSFTIICWINFVAGGSIFYTQVTVIPSLLDIFLPLNESRQRLFFTIAEYPFDPYRHYYELWAFYTIYGIVNSSVVLSADSTFLMFLYQNLGLFAITKHRLKKTWQIKDEESIHKQIVSAIVAHQQAIEFFNTIESIYRKFNLLMIGLSVIVISSTAITAMERTDNFLNFMRTIFLEFGVVAHLLFISGHGQIFINQTEDLFDSVYSTNWYKMPEKTKKLIGVMMIRSKKSCIFFAGGFYAMNLQNFGNVIKTSMSYITVALNFR